MYIHPEMIEMGLRKGLAWPSDSHKKVAINLAIQNPNVTQLDIMTDIIDSVNKVPMNRIESITLEELLDEFGCPRVFHY